MAVDLVRSFNKLSFKDTALAVIYAPLSFFNLARNDDDKYVGPTLTLERDYANQIKAAQESGDKFKAEKLIRQNPYKKSGGREWVESIVFAVFAAAFIRMFLIEAFVIPTPSMEGSLLVGDFLFVSKAHYGIRTPMTVLQVPLLHNRVPFFNTESYLEKPNLNYYRLPALQEIERNTPFVFNWPVGDSVYLTPSRSWAVGQVRRNQGIMAQDAHLRSLVRKKDFITRPVDKKDHYIKRCVGLPGDSLEIKNRQIYINGKASLNPSGMQFLYQLTSGGNKINLKKLDEWGINIAEGNPGQGVLFMTPDQAEKVKTLGVKVDFFPHRDRDLFPHDKKNFPGWTNDNFGPIYIPEAGATVKIDPTNIALYSRIINVYEGNDLEVKNGRIYINGQESNAYTFKQDYYWAMGDNRHNSEDSRAWGYVPADHIVGKPLFIWFSTKNGSISNGINWSRIFTSANKM